MLKWCPDFISKEEGDALFKHLMEGICLHTTAKFRKLADFYSFSELNFEHTKISMYGKPVNLVSIHRTTKTAFILSNVASSSIVVRRRGIDRKGTVSETKATCLDSTNAKAQNAT